MVLAIVLSQWLCANEADAIPVATQSLRAGQRVRPVSGNVRESVPERGKTAFPGSSGVREETEFHNNQVNEGQ